MRADDTPGHYGAAPHASNPESNRTRNHPSGMEGVEALGDVEGHALRAPHDPDWTVTV